MKNITKAVAAAALAVGLVVAASAPANADSSTWGPKVCSPALRPAIYIATVGDLFLYIDHGPGGFGENWYNPTRTTRVKLTPVGNPGMDSGLANFSGTPSNKGSDCRLV